MFKVGADPELFVKEGNRYVSAFGLIPGEKRVPFPVPKGAIQVDGMAAEFNIDPAESLDEWCYNIDTVLSFLKKSIEKDGRQLVADAVAKFDPEYMFSRSEQELVLGCDPDFNAYTLSVNDRPDAHPFMRTAAGHIHVSWGEDFDTESLEHMLLCADVTKHLDFYDGLPSVVLDEDNERKQMYGRAGAFRPKQYGCEYRVASNFWLKDKKLHVLMYENTMQGLNTFFTGTRLNEIYGNICEDIINNNKKDDARELCKEIGIPLSV